MNNPAVVTAIYDEVWLSLFLEARFESEVEVRSAVASGVAALKERYTQTYVAMSLILESILIEVGRR
jgi:hypothetical protein